MKTSRNYQLSGNQWVRTRFKSFMLYAVLSSLLSFVLPLTAMAAESWSQQDANGFGDPNNVKILPMEGSGYNGDFYAGTNNTTDGGELWKTTDGTTWTNVITGGFEGNSDNTVIGVGIVWNGDLYGYAGNETDSPEIWRSADGSNWAKVSSLGLPPGGGIWTGIPLGDYLYAGSWGISNGGRIFRSLDGLDWEDVSPSPGFGDSNNGFAMTREVWNENLFVTVGGPTTGLYKTPEETDWSEIEIDGDPANTAGVQSVEAFQGQLYVANGASDIWRSPDGINNWTTATATGFGDANTHLNQGSFRNVNGNLYTSADNAVTGPQVWRSDGVSWSNVSPSWDTGNWDARNMNTFKGKLYISTSNPAGGELWALDFDNTPNGFDVSPDVGGETSVTFAEITTPGSTLVQQENWRPSSYQLEGTFYEISTSATYDGTITITFSYDESALSGEEEDLQMWHQEEDGSWVQIPTTVDVDNDRVTGEGTSLSGYAYSSSPSSPSSSPATGINTIWLFVAALLMLGAGLVRLAGGPFSQLSSGR